MPDESSLHPDVAGEEEAVGVFTEVRDEKPDLPDGDAEGGEADGSRPKKSIFDNKVFILILSFVIAFGMWFYVNGVYNTTDTNEYKSVPVSIVFEGSIPQQSNLTILDVETATVDVSVTGSRVLLANLKKDDISITVDMDTVTAAGEYHLPIFISLPSPDLLSVSEQSLTSLRITFDKFEKKEVPVTATTVGSLGKDYILDGITLSPTSMMVEGPQTLVDQVESVAVDVDVDGLTAGKTFRADTAFVDSLGEPISSGYLVSEFETVSAYASVLKVREVILSVSAVNKSGGTDKTVQEIVIEPQTITVAGAEAEIDLLNQLSLGIIDTALIDTSQTYTFDIPAPNGVKVLSDASKVTVEVAMPGAVTRSVSVTDFDISGLPEGLTATLANGSIAVKVRGLVSALEQLDVKGIVAVVDASGITTTSGPAVCPVTFTVPAGHDIGICGQYTVVLTIR